MTVAPPVTMSPPAKTPFLDVFIVSLATTTIPLFAVSKSGVVLETSGLATLSDCNHHHVCRDMGNWILQSARACAVPKRPVRPVRSEYIPARQRAPFRHETQSEWSTNGIHALLLGMVDFFAPGWHLRLRAPVNDHRFLRPKPQGGSSRVHSGIAAADSNHPLTTRQSAYRIPENDRLSSSWRGSDIRWTNRLRPDFHRDPEEPGQASARPQENRIVLLQ